MGGLVPIFAAGFASVFLLGFQSRNVNAGHYGWAAVTSFAIAVAQVAVLSRVIGPSASWTETLTYGASGALGITASMRVHARFIAKGRA
jgi:hypothetical protein